MKGVKMTKKKKLALLKRQWALHMILWIGLVYLLIFSYIPMVGIIIAFKQYKLASGIKGFFTSEWVGLKWFAEFFASPLSGMYIRNTVVLSALKLLVCFPIPILFALMLNEVRSSKFKKFVQTASYLPHFISWIIVSGLCFNMFSSVNGVVNELLLKGGIIDTPLSILYDGKQYWGLAVGTEVWKEMGWNAIIYIAAIAGIDSTLYEAAEIDGASRLQRIRYVTFPGLKDIIIIMFILSLGGLVSGNMDQAMMLGNTMNRDYSEIINSYVLKIGMANFRFDYAAAVGLMQSLISVVLVFSANAASRKATGAAIY